MGVRVEDLVEEIRKNLNHKNASQEDEVKVMQAMLNDTSFVVGVYGKNGKEGEYCPAADFKKMTASIVSSAVKITKDEATSIMNEYEVSKSEAEAMVGISKQFINTYLETDRKLPLGGRKDTNFQLARRIIPERSRPCPKRVGVAEDGKALYETPITVTPQHIGIRVFAAIPEWSEVYEEE